MKVTAGSDRPSKPEFTKNTSEAPKPGKNELKIPKSVTDNPQKHRLQHTVRPIANGYIQSTSYDHPDHGYVNHEYYHAENPLDVEGAGEEKANTFGKVGGLK